MEGCCAIANCNNELYPVTMRLRRKSARYAFLRQLNEHVGKQVRLYRFVRCLSGFSMKGFRGPDRARETTATRYAGA